MKSECTYTRKRLPRHVEGRLFKLQQRRIERHLGTCPLCRSEFDALRRKRETEQFLRDLEPSSGMIQGVRKAGSALVRLFYRPFWVVLIVGAAVLLHRQVIDPVLHDPDLEQLDTGIAPQADVPAAAVQTAPTPSVSSLPEAKPEPASKAEVPPATDPLVVTISVDGDHERESLKHINDAMKEHALLRTMRFSDKVREVAGNLTADELYVFFGRIKDAAKIGYKRSRLSAAGSGELIPVVLRVRVEPAPVVRQDAPAPAPRAEQPVKQPTAIPLDKPAEKPASVPAPQKIPAEQSSPGERPVQ